MSKKASTVPKIKIDLNIIMINFYTKFHYVHLLRRHWKKTAHIHNFSMLKGHNSVEICSFLTYLVNIIMIKLYIKSASSANKMKGKCWWTDGSKAIRPPFFDEGIKILFNNKSELSRTEESIQIGRMYIRRSQTDGIWLYNTLTSVFTLYIGILNHYTGNTNTDLLLG